MKVLPLSLKTVTRTQPANVALKDGRVAPASFDLQFEEVDPLIAAFRRMVRELEYDVCELAITTYLCAKEHGRAFTALPIFLVRQFHHGAVVVAKNGRVHEPKDLEGCRVGVNRGYTVTTGVWARGILADEHGLELDSITWMPSGDEHVTEYEPPANVVSLPADADMTALLLNGELAAVVGAEIDHPDVVPLIQDPMEVGYAALRDRGHYPINHLVVVRDELIAANPSLPGEVTAAFEQAKELYVQGGDLLPMHQRVREMTGRDPLPYGVEPNRAMIDELIDHTVDQAILSSRPDVDSLFA
jgi:4,5-dihydroxyphthalate decarboxylase